ncbi:MAG: asparagine synthase (glutamine-hydrolyzing) [Acidobacteriota bacterium]|nr:MAG: asparagine synthase (glutamine-hydrolyzing) [Acidobacteriota bacterium]
MCGIVGFTTKNFGDEERGVLERMNEAIVHRGPDDDGFYFGEGVGMAMRRLSIIDLASGKQPIHNRDKTKWIVYNGEIYNYQSLRADLEKDGDSFYTNSDTEVILHLYDKHGKDCLKHLRGMFAFAIWDENERSLFIARDRVGKKPLLFSHRPNGDLIFGSEFRAVLEHPAISREVDHEAIDAYLSYLCVPAPMTGFKQIRKLEPGHWLFWKDGEIKTERYWLPDFSKKIKISEEDAIEETTRILRESVKLRMISEVPLGAFLSGGVDSSTVVALMAEVSDRPVKTFSIGFEEQDYSELKYARKVAEHVGAEYNEFIVKPDAARILPMLVDHYGEPYADWSAIPTYYVSRETRRFVTVALNGDGGDESFAGYERYVAMKLAETYRKVPGPLRKGLIEVPIGLLPHSEIKRSRFRDAKRFLASAGKDPKERYFRLVTAISEELKADLYTREYRASLSDGSPLGVIGKWLGKNGGRADLDRVLLTDLLTYLPNDLLVKVDIASMANSLEARSPLLDHKLIEFAASLPKDLKVRRLQPKYLLKKIASRLVPPDVVYRKKMGFGVPVGHWFRGELRPMVEDLLLSEAIEKRGLFNPDAVRNMVRAHTSRQKDYSHQIQVLLMLELWYRRFID